MGRLSTAGLLVFGLLIGFVAGCETRIPATDSPLNLPILPTTPVPTLPPLTGPFVYQVPTETAPWPHYNGTRINGRVVGVTSAQESSTLRIEVRRDYGASVQIYDKITNQALINFYDLGRESGMSSYGGPSNYASDAPGTWQGIGYNALQAGDDGKNPSPILFHGNVNGWIYTKAQCLSWPHRNARRLPFFYEQWVRLDGNKVHVRVRLTHERPDKTFYEPRAQEWPMMIINDARRVHFYNGSEPFTGDATITTDAIESRNGNANIVTHQRTPFGLTEPWQGIEIGTSAGAPRLIGLYTPGFFLGNYNVDAVAARENWEGGNTNTYVANQPLAHLDSDNTWLRSYTYIVGTEKDIRDYVYTQERFPRPDFVFNQFNGRSGWVIFDGGSDQKEPFSADDWRVTFTGKVENGVQNAQPAKLLSPYGSWRAAEFNTIYIRMAYSGPPGIGPQTTLQLHYLLNGQAAEGVSSEFPNQNRIRFPRGVRNRGEQSVAFNVFNDGQFHTYKISFADHPKWTGIIQQFDITHPISPAFVPPGEVLTLRYFGTRDPGE